GDVHVTQGDTTLKCKTLAVYYDQNATPGTTTTTTQTSATSQPGMGAGQSIRRLEAKGGVVVTQKDQTATGETGLFDMKTNTVTLLGNVVITQGQNVVRGKKLVVDLTTGVSKVEGQGGRVEGLFMPGSTPGSAPTGSHDGRP